MLARTRCTPAGGSAGRARRGPVLCSNGDVSDDPATDDRIDIDVELVEGVGAHRSRPGTHDGAAGSSVGGRGHAPGRRTGVGIAAVVLSVALGVAVGRSTSGGDEGVAARDEPGATSASLEPTDTSDDTIPPVATPVTTVAPASVAPAETATTAAPPVTATQIDLDPRIAGIDQQLVAPRGDGTWARLDLADGVLEEFVERRPPSIAFRDSTLVAGQGWFTYLPQRGSGDLLVWRDATLSWEIVSLGSSFEILREAGTDRFWVAGRGEPGEALELVGIDGEQVGERIELPAGTFATASDPRGGVVVWAGARLFGVTPDEREPIVAGRLLAMDENLAVGWECDDDLACGIDVIDRISGQRRRVPGADSEVVVGRLLAGGSFGVGDLSRPLAPDGSVIATTTFASTRAELTLLDLATGRLQVIAGGGTAFPLVWTPDSRYLVFVDGGVPLAYDRGTGDVFSISARGELTGWIDLVEVT